MLSRNAPEKGGSAYTRAKITNAFELLAERSKKPGTPESHN